MLFCILLLLCTNYCAAKLNLNAADEASALPIGELKRGMPRFELLSPTIISDWRERLIEKQAGSYVSEEPAKMLKSELQTSSNLASQRRWLHGWKQFLRPRPRR